MTTTDLIPVDQAIAHEAGFRLPVVLTKAVHEDCVAWTDADTEQTGVPQDETGRLWDVLWMAVLAARSTLAGGQPRGVSDLPVRFVVCRVPRDLDRSRLAELEDAGELAQLVSLTLRRGEGGTLVIEAMA